mmetsp:Transcript_132887/g.384214  ORF Transcript_132887/g.384214 Transcript_132887/m.384214 type:complete len:630 (-) Transcript_132887:58-1947(-)
MVLSRHLAALACWAWAADASEWFGVTQYRAPGQCERMACLSVRVDNCRDHLHGFYLREKGCTGGKICTDCSAGNMTNPAICYCENPPYSVQVTYGQDCGMGKDCTEGICFRPCHTFMHVTVCPEDYCAWDTFTKTCSSKPAFQQQVSWLVAQDGPTRTIAAEGEDVVLLTPESSYPLSYQSFRQSALGFRIKNILIDDVVDLRSLFAEMDLDRNGFLDPIEFSVLPGVLERLDAQVVEEIIPNQTAAEAEQEAAARRLQTVNVTITPEICSSKRPREYFCSFDVSCKLDCRECGWKSATDTAFASCVRPTPDACWADGGKVFCESDQLCHPPGDCSNCVDRPVVDHSQHKCLQLWWGEQPLTQMKDWVCRFRNKNGMPCYHDQDCVHGLKRCIYGKCQPFQPYNPNQTCTGDLDCPHIGYYCPRDPTGGENQFWVQYCREQGGEMMTCNADRECKPDLRCNTAEPQPRCRRLFSLPIGAPAAADILCEHGWRDRSSKCAPPAMSKQLGRPCETHDDCETTDASGRTAECVCKQWWESGDPTYCDAVTGDYANHQEKLRDLYDFRAKNCGTFWTEEECLRVFGNEAKKLKLAVQCERQQLTGGPYLPHPDCLLVDQERFPDYCAELNSLR